MSRSPFLVMAIPLMLVSGCAPLRLRTLELPPQLTQWYQYGWYEGAWCNVPLPGSGLNARGTAPTWHPDPGEVLSGFDDFHDPGSDPFPCVYQFDQNYRGQVQFDLTQFDRIVGADLVFSTSQSRSWDGEPVGQIPPVSIATTLGVSTDGWNFDHSIPLPTGPQFDINVTSQVRNWTSRTHQNFGFVIAGPRLNIPSDLGNDTGGKMSWYGGFKLVVVYNPALNPRAPP
jgi:hypothetical protein